MHRFLITALAGAALMAASATQAAETPEAPAHDWSFTGLFGTYDRDALRRGFQVYKEVCAVCHAMNRVAYRNLGSIGFAGGEITEIAAEYEVEDGPDEDGEMFFRPARPSDRFVSPFENEAAARAANGGAYPLDLSLIVKAREGGADYIRALLVGYRDEPPEGFELNVGMYYNDYFPGHQIAMPPPMVEDQVEYEDGTPATVEQMAEDVTVFMTWATSPEMEARKNMGISVLIFRVVLTGMLYALKRQIWSDVH